MKTPAWGIAVHLVACWDYALARPDLHRDLGAPFEDTLRARAAWVWLHRKDPCPEWTWAGFEV